MAGGKPRFFGRGTRHLVDSVRVRSWTSVILVGPSQCFCFCDSVVCPHEQPLGLHSKLMLLTHIVVRKSAAKRATGEARNQPSGHWKGEGLEQWFSWQLATCSFRARRSPAVTVIAVIKVNHILPFAYMTFFSLYMRTEMNFLVVFEDDEFTDFTGGLITHFSFQLWKRKLCGEENCSSFCEILKKAVESISQSKNGPHVHWIGDILKWEVVLWSAVRK